MPKNKTLISYIASLLLFAVIALFYCLPVLSGSGILQPDIVQSRGMAQEMREFQEETGENSYWSNAMFGGMPTYQTGAQYDYDWIKIIDKTLRFLPRPADYIFLLFTGFFILGIVILKDWKFALVGSIFFAFCAYYFIIIAAGHNAKVHAIAYFAPLVAGILLLYEGKWILGFVLTTLFLGLELSTNHPQMTYYLLLAMVVFAIIQLVEHIKQNQIVQFIKASILVTIAGVFAIGLNSGRILSTYEYSKSSIRGDSEVTLTNENQDGLEKSYITQWSYGKIETLNLLIPNLTGGESSSDPEQMKNYTRTVQRQFKTVIKEEVDEQILSQIAQHQIYWGNQPFTSGPAYQGAIVVFLFILGLFLVGRKWAKFKWWLLGATILSILLAWGENLQWFTDIFIEFVPFYDKFRAVSSILVIAEFTMPLLAMICLYCFFMDKSLEPEKRKKITLYVGSGLLFILLLFYVSGETIFGFLSQQDILIREQILGAIGEFQPNQLGKWEFVINELENAIKKDRVALFQSDLLRTIFFIAICFATLIAYQYNVVKNKIIAISIIGIFALIDGFSIAKRYLNEDNFVKKTFVNNPYPTQETSVLLREARKNQQMTQMLSRVPYNASLQDLKEKDTANYRVFNYLFSTFNEANTSYFRNSIGGYHGAKMGNIQDLIDLYFTNDTKAEELGTAGKTQEILNLLNAKYIIAGSPDKPEINYNQNAFGNAWLVNGIHWVNNANEEILALKEVNVKDSVILRKDLYGETIQENSFTKDSLSSIELVNYQPNKLLYKVKAKQEVFAVFSEIFYDKGWKAYLSKSPSENDKELEIYKVDYALRGLKIPKGEWFVRFHFDPQVIKTAKIITQSCNILFLIIILTGGFLLIKKRFLKEKENPN